MRRTWYKAGALVPVGVMLVVSSACSFSASSRSSSASSRSSSGRGGEEPVASIKGFQEEIAAIAVLYVGSGGTADDFQRDITAAAKRNGIPYWELDERMFAAIGIGLERAGVKREAIASLPFLQGVKNAAQFNAIGNAYGRGR